MTSGSGKHLSKQIGPAGRRRRGSATQAVASAPVWLGTLGSSPSAGASRPRCLSDCRGSAGAAPSLSRSIIAAAAFFFLRLSIWRRGYSSYPPPPPLQPTHTHTPDQGPTQRAIICYSLVPCAAASYLCALLLPSLFHREWATAPLRSHSCTQKEPLRQAVIG